MIEHRIEIETARRVNPKAASDFIGQDSWFTSYAGQRIGEFREPICAAARWLLASGKAAEADTIVLCRNGRPSLSGNVGALSGATVKGIHFAKWDGERDDLTPVPMDDAKKAVLRERLALGRAKKAAKLAEAA
jgi:hypothetical protein